MGDKRLTAREKRAAAKKANQAWGLVGQAANLLKEAGCIGTAKSCDSYAYELSLLADNELLALGINPDLDAKQVVEGPNEDPRDG